MVLMWLPTLLRVKALKISNLATFFLHRGLSNGALFVVGGGVPMQVPMRVRGALVPLKTAKPNPLAGFGFAYAVCGAAGYLVISTTDDWGCSVTVTTPFLGRICIDRFSGLT